MPTRSKHEAKSRVNAASDRELFEQLRAVDAEWERLQNSHQGVLARLVARRREIKRAPLWPEGCVERPPECVRARLAAAQGKVRR